MVSEKEILRLAKETGFVIRAPKKVTPMGFIRMLLFDQLKYEIPSLENHTMNLDSTNDIELSKEGLNKRFTTSATSFVEKVFEAYWQHTLDHDSIPTALKSKFNAIRILDSTEFKLPAALAKEFPGYSSAGAPACAAIQFEYDIISKKVCNLSLGNAKESDKTFADNWMGNINEGDLILRDLGYYSIGSYKKIEDRKANYISRLKSIISIFEKQDDKFIELDLKMLIKRIEKSKQGYIDQTVYIGATEKKEIRLMAWLLDEDAQRKRLAKKNGKKGKTNNHDKLWSMLNIFVTNIPTEEITPQEAYELYKIRWQVELMFKTWKSILKLAKVRKMKAERIICYLYAKLLWVLLYWDITAKLEPVIWMQKKKLISIFKCFQILKGKADELKVCLFNTSEGLKEWLVKMVYYFGKYGLRENKKGRKNIAEILQYS